MSSTNRGAKREAADLYPTPLSAFEPMLPLLAATGAAKFWEPASGDDRLIHAMASYGLICGGNDLCHGYDYLKDDTYYDCIVTNPPFSLALEFCNKGWHFSDHLFLLLRLNFLGSGIRKQWFTDHEPNAVFVLTQRPKFVKNKTDSCEYGWFYWGQHPFKPFNHL